MPCSTVTSTDLRYRRQPCPSRADTVADIAERCSYVPPPREVTLYASQPGYDFGEFEYGLAMDATPRRHFLGTGLGAGAWSMESCAPKLPRSRLASMTVTACPQLTGVPGRRSGGDPGLSRHLESAPDIEMHSLMIIRHGQVVAEGWWSPYLPEQPHLLYSLSKSFTSTAAAFAIAEGLLDLDATVLSYFPELDSEITDRRSRSILVRHVAAMASGHLEETIERTMALDPVEPVRGFLLIPPDREPGSVFAYNQPCTYTLAAIVQRLTGQTLIEYLRPRLFDPLGIDQAGWQRDAAGRDLGYTGLHATTDAVARLGLLYLQRGVWNGQRLLSEEWVAEATRLR